MIKYSYQIERNEGNEIKTYIPDKIPTEIPNLVYIEGPNSSGKSTLLNIIALGLHGQKNKTITRALSSKMQSLLDTDYQTLKFSFKITNENDKKFELLSSKKDSKLNEIVVYEYINGKKTILAPELLERKYNIIYDIPNNPTERINKLADSIKEIQVVYGNRLGQLKDQILKVLNQIKDSRDPKRLKKLEDQLESATIQHKTTSEKIKIDERNLEQLERYAYSRFYAEYFERCIKYQQQIEQLDNESQNVTQKTKKQNSDFSKKWKRLETTINSMKDDYAIVTTLLKMLLPKTEQHHLDVWERISLDDPLRDLEFDDSLYWELSNFTSIFSKMQQNKKHEEALLEAKLYRDLISFLNQYEQTKILIPGLEKPISDFIDILKKANEKNESLLRFTANIDKILEIIESIEDNRKLCINHLFPDLKKMNFSRRQLSEEINNEKRIRDEMKKLNEVLNATNKRRLLYEGECTRRQISLENLNELLEEFENLDAFSPYFIYDERQLMQKIADVKKSLTQTEEDLKNQDFWIAQYKSDIAKLKKMELHKYHDRIDFLNCLLNITQKLQQQFMNRYAIYINEIIEKKPISKQSTNSEKQKYIEEVSKYLGKRVGTIRYIDNVYDVDEINLCLGIVKTTQGKIIRLSDFGTGHSQSAYLLGKLNTEDNRPIIALFDEVAMMDKSSLELICDKLRELYSQNRLLVGIVVQMANQINVKPILRSEK